LNTPASSEFSYPAIRFSCSVFGNPLTISARTSGPILAAQPEALTVSVSLGGFLKSLQLI